MKNNIKRREMIATVNSKKVNKLQAEANARRKVAKSWAFLAKGVKYQEAATKELCTRTTLQVEGELFDGIILSLCDRNSVKPQNVQKRILRRIVEKRQAQSAHHNIGRSDSRYTNHVSRRCTSKSMSDIHRYQSCA